MHRTPVRIGAAAAVATLLLAGCATTPPVASTAPTTAPAASTPSPAATPAPTRTPTGTKRVDSIGGATGRFDKTFTLLHAGVAATAETSAWETQAWHPGGCPTDGLKRALGSVTASRVIGMTGPEIAFAEGVLRFPSDAEASAFLAEMAASHAKGCVTTQAADGSNRDLYNTAPVTAGDEGLAVSNWIEMKVNGSYSEVPGGGLGLYVRKGSYVVLSEFGGESVGDLARPTNDSAKEWHAELRKAVDHVLKQL